ncbi:hypothetical protein ACFLYG_01180 [Chloroflexota bacterium]
MKSIVDYFLIWWLHSGRYRWSWLRRRLFEHHYRNIPLPVVNSLEEVQACLKQVKWTMDGPMHLFDCISYPQTTWSKKRDDCDGFSSLAAALLNSWDVSYNPVLVTAIVRPIKSSHTVCAFKNQQGGLWFFDNYSLRCEDYQTYEDIVNKISERAQRLLCWDIREPATLKMIEFHRL